MPYRKDRSPTAECNAFSKLADEQRLVVGSKWFVISGRWFQNWSDYSGYVKAGNVSNGKVDDGYEVVAPGPIDNTDLLGNFDQELRRGLIEGRDYKFIPQKAYEKLDQWYGGGPHFPRSVIPQGDSKEPIVDLYPIRFPIYRCSASGLPEDEYSEVLWFSRTQTILHIKEEIFKTMKADKETAHLWVRVESANEEDDSDLQAISDDASSSGSDTGGSSSQLASSKAVLPVGKKNSKQSSGGGRSMVSMFKGRVRRFSKSHKNAVTDEGIASKGAAMGGANKSDGSADSRSGGGSGGGGGSTGSGNLTAKEAEGDEIFDIEDKWELVDSNNNNRRLEEVVLGATVVSTLVEVPLPSTDAPPTAASATGTTGVDDSLAVLYRYPRQLIRWKWRFKLELGCQVDAKDKEENWFESTIVGTGRTVEEAEEEAKRWYACGGRLDALPRNKERESLSIRQRGERYRYLRLHFMGWSPKFDETMDRFSDRLSPLNSMVEYWRDLVVDDLVELRHITNPDGSTGEYLSKGGKVKWYESVVIGVDHNLSTVLVEPCTREMRADGSAVPKTRNVPVDSEEICKIGTHTNKRDPQAAQGRRNRSGSASSASDGSSGGGGGGGSTRSGGGHGVGTRSGGGSGGWYGGKDVKGVPVVAGSVGLYNLGNTCFMNSMLQCLSNTEQLTQHFLSGRYHDELNYDNPLGMNGKVANAYAKLLRNIWGGYYTILAPGTFKRVIGQFRPQFAGYQQQDSQEFMSFLLDGLHEDLNRIQQKPYIENVEADTQTDLVKVSMEAWRRHLLRNDSAVVDHCQGLLKSHVNCSVCPHQSTTFDPYMSLSLPLPVLNLKHFYVYIFRSRCGDKYATDGSGNSGNNGNNGNNGSTSSDGHSGGGHLTARRYTKTRNLMRRPVSVPVSVDQAGTIWDVKRALVKEYMRYAVVASQRYDGGPRPENGASGASGGGGGGGGGSGSGTGRSKKTLDDPGKYGDGVYEGYQTWTRVKEAEARAASAGGGGSSSSSTGGSAVVESSDGPDTMDVDVDNTNGGASGRGSGSGSSANVAGPSDGFIPLVPTHLALTTVFGHRVTTILSNEEPIAEIRSGTGGGGNRVVLYCYETDHPVQAERGKTKGKRSSSGSSSSGGGVGSVASRFSGAFSLRGSNNNNNNNSNNISSGGGGGEGADKEAGPAKIFSLQMAVVRRGGSSGNSSGHTGSGGKACHLEQFGLPLRVTYAPEAAAEKGGSFNSASTSSSSGEVGPDGKPSSSLPPLPPIPTTCRRVHDICWRHVSRFLLENEENNDDDYGEEEDQDPGAYIEAIKRKRAPSSSSSSNKLEAMDEEAGPVVAATGKSPSGSSGGSGGGGGGGGFFSRLVPFGSSTNTAKDKGNGDEHGGTSSTGSGVRPRSGGSATAGAVVAGGGGGGGGGSGRSGPPWSRANAPYDVLVGPVFGDAHTRALPDDDTPFTIGQGQVVTIGFSSETRQQYIDHDEINNLFNLESEKKSFYKRYGYLPNDDKGGHRGGAGGGTGSGHGGDGKISLFDCFNKLIEREQLEEHNLWYCAKCKEHNRAYKKFDLWTTPDVLILHLKRFLYVPGTYFVHRQKINDLVTFPINDLDLTAFVQASQALLGPPKGAGGGEAAVGSTAGGGTGGSGEVPSGATTTTSSTSPTAPTTNPSCLYDLYAVSEHSGGMGGGHYTAVAMNYTNKRWYRFNDSNVTEVPPEAAITSKAYVLFYRRKTGSHKWGGMPNVRELAPQK